MQSKKPEHVQRATFLNSLVHLYSATQNAKMATTQRTAGCALIRTPTTQSRKVKILSKSDGLSKSANLKKIKSTTVNMENRSVKFGHDSQVQAEKLR